MWKAGRLEQTDRCMGKGWRMGLSWIVPSIARAVPSRNDMRVEVFDFGLRKINRCASCALTKPAKPRVSVSTEALLKSAGYSFLSYAMTREKPAKTYSEQLELLKSRGLVVEDEALALHRLAHHNYYRLSAYRFPLTVFGDPDQFQYGVTFETLWGLYEFDRGIKQLLSEALKAVEISVRSRWAFVLGHAHGSQAFELPNVFSNRGRHEDALRKLDDELRRSEEPFVAHYREQHAMSRPPIWAACEVMSFGMLSQFYANTSLSQDRKAIAKTYLLFPENMKSFLQHAAYVRNLCAHHARLWNRRFTITLSLPQSQPRHMLSSLHPAENRKIYNTLVMLGHMMDVIEPDHTWRARLIGLIEAQKYPVTAEMGFPPDWRDRPAWKI